MGDWVCLNIMKWHGNNRGHNAQKSKLEHHSLGIKLPLKSGFCLELVGGTNPTLMGTDGNLIFIPWHSFYESSRISDQVMVKNPSVRLVSRDWSKSPWSTIFCVYTPVSPPMVTWISACRVSRWRQISLGFRGEKAWRGMLPMWNWFNTNYDLLLYLTIQFRA